MKPLCSACAVTSLCIYRISLPPFSPFSAKKKKKKKKSFKLEGEVQQWFGITSFLEGSCLRLRKESLRVLIQPIASGALFPCTVSRQGHKQSVGLSSSVLLPCILYMSLCSRTCPPAAVRLLLGQVSPFFHLLKALQIYL